MITRIPRSSPEPCSRGAKGALRRSLSLFMTLLLLAASLRWPAIGAHAAYPGAVEDARGGVVRVLYDVSGEYWAHSVAFAVGATDDGAQIFVTFNEMLAETSSGCYITTTDVNGGIPAEVLYQSEEHNFAVLRTAKPLTDRHPLPLRSPKGFSDTNDRDCFCIGYPNRNENDPAGNSRIDGMLITDGIVTQTDLDYEGTAIVVASTSSEGWFYGGPMVDEYGQVIGVVVRFDKGYGLAVSIDHVIDGLNTLGLPYTPGVAGGVPAATAPPETTAEPTPTAAPAQTAEPEMTAAPEPTGSGGGLSMKTALIVGGCALLLIAMIGLLLVQRGKKKEAVSPPLPEYWYCPKCGRRNDRSCDRCVCETSVTPVIPVTPVTPVTPVAGLKPFRSDTPARKADVGPGVSSVFKPPSL